MVRFQKRIKIGKGFNLNLSKSGIGYSVGPRGFKASFGPSGMHLHAGIPGTGLSQRTKIGSTGSYRKNQDDIVSLISQLDFNIDEQGKLFITDSSGNPLDEDLLKKLKRTDEYKEQVAKLYDTTLSTFEENSQKFLEIYKFVPEIRNYDYWQDTLTNLKNIEYTQKNFTIKKPDLEDVEKQLVTEAQSIKSVFFWKNDNLKREFIEKNKLNRFDIQMKDWKEKKTSFDNQEMQRKKEIDHQNKENEDKREEIVSKILPGDPDYINSEIEKMLGILSLPIDFSVDFNYSNEGKLYLDLDLPEIEDIPNKKATILKSGKLKIEEKKVKELNEDYVKCVTGLAFFLAGHFFNISPKIGEIQISGYTQRLSKKTGNVQDQYIYSIQFVRTLFEKLTLNNIDPLLAFDNFNHVIDLNSKYELKEIKPF